MVDSFFMDEMPPFASNESQDLTAAHRRQMDQALRVAVESTINMGNNVILQENEIAIPPGSPEFLLQAVIVPGSQTDEGLLVKAVALPWFDIVDLLLKDPRAMYELDPRKLEEIIAGAYQRQGFGVTLTPRSGDGGRDVIAVRHDVGSIRFFDQVKRYSPQHVVTLEEIDAWVFSAAIVTFPKGLSQRRQRLRHV